MSTRTVGRQTHRAQLAPVMEVFASIQGEGMYVGERQSFLRLRGCPMRCRYCDTPASWRVKKEAEEWCSPFQAMVRVGDVENDTPRTISVTGGEPLLWPEFLIGLRAIAGQRRVHLETAGGHPQTLARVLGMVDHVSLDLKVAEDLDAPEEQIVDRADALPTDEVAPRNAEEWGRARRRSLALVREHDACAKIVVCGGTDIAAYEKLLDEVLELAPELPVILQPATAMREVESPSMEDVMELADTAAEKELTVRVLPQVHRQLSIQ